MLTLPKVHSIPAGVSLARVLVESLWQEYKNDFLALSDVEIYLPNRRAARSLADMFLEVSAGQATILPRLTPLGDIEDDNLIETDPFVIEEDPFLQPAIPVFERQILLAQLVMKWSEQTGRLFSVTEAYSLATDLARMIDRAHTEGVDLGKIETLVPGDLARHWQVTADFLKIVTEFWPAILAERGQVDPAYRRNLLLHKKAESLRRNPPQHRIIAAGSTGSIPATASLLDIISRLPNGCVILPCFDPAIDEKIWNAIDEQHPYFFQKRLLERFQIEPKHVKQWPDLQQETPCRDKEKLLHAALQPKEIFDLSTVNVKEETLSSLSFIAADHSNHEARIIALILRDIVNKPPETAIVVTSDRELAAKIQLEMKRWNILIDDSGGRSLDQSPIGIYLRLIADMLVTTVPATHLLSILRDPLTVVQRDSLILKQETAALETILRRGPLPSDGLHNTTLQEESPLLAEVLQILSPFFDGHVLSLAEWITHHITITEQLAQSPEEQGADRLWSGDDGEAVALLLQQLLAVPTLRTVKMHAADYTAFIRTLLQQVILRPTQRLHPRLRILSPIEARLQQADLFILAGLNEGVWPGQAQQDAWLSRPMRRELGFLDNEARIGQAALDFTSLFCAPRVIVTYSVQRDNGLAHPSRWIQQIFAVMQKFNTDPKVNASPFYHWAKLWDRPNLLSPQKAPAPSPAVEYRPKKLSVTDIERWRKDPYTIYAKNILRLYPQEDLDRSIDVRDWGLAAHGILEDFFKENAHRAPNPLERFHDIARRTLKNYALNPSQKMKWESRLFHLGNWIVTEALRQPHDIFVERNASYSFRLQNGHDFLLHGRTDRLDVFPTGLTITDYKTGTVPSAAQLLDGTAPQLPLLGLLFKSSYPTIKSLRYIHLSGTERQPAKIQEFDNTDDLIAANKEHVENLLHDYYVLQTPYTAQALNKNQYDAYKQLKRVAEWAIANDSDEEENDAA